MHVGAIALHWPSGEVPSPLQVIASVSDSPNPVAHENVHELP